MATEFLHLECPACEWDCVVVKPLIALGRTCPVCAADNGRNVYLERVLGELPDLVEGDDARIDR